MTTDIFSAASAGPTEVRDEKARRAVKAFRGMQPWLTGYARALTKNKTISVELAQGSPKTDGKKIFYRPPLALGDLAPHDRPNCDRRDRITLQLICAACNVREEVMITIVHEIAHIAFGTFETPNDKDVKDVIRRAIEENGTKYGKMIARQLEDNPEWALGSYMSLSQAVSPFLPIINNSLEDARVDTDMFRARKGTKVMFDALIQKTFADGVTQPDGSIVKWDTYPLNSQVMLGVFVLACKYKFDGWFAPEVEEALRDPNLVQVVRGIDTARDAGATYKLSFNVLAALRELGFCKNDNEPDEEPEDESTDESEEDDSSSEGDQSSDEETDADPEGGESDQNDTDDGESSGDDATPDGSTEDGSPDESSGDSEGDTAGTSDPDDSEGSEEAGEKGAEGEPSDSDLDSEDGGPASDGESAGEGEDVGEPDSGDDSGGAGEGQDDGSDGNGSSKDGASEGASESDSSDESGESSAGPTSDGSSDDAGDPSGDRSGEEEGGENPEGSDISGKADSSRGGAGGPGKQPSEPQDGELSDDEASNGDRNDSQDSGSTSGAGGSNRDGSPDDSDGTRDDDAEVGDDTDDAEASGNDAGPEVGGSGSTTGGAAGARADASELGRDDLRDELVESEEQDERSNQGPESEGSGSEELIDTGADDGEGGQTTKSPPKYYGSAEEVSEDVKIFSKHDVSVGDHGDSASDEKAIDRAIVQSLYFETPSTEVNGVRIHIYGDSSDRTAEAWDTNSYYRGSGSKADTDIPESILGPALLQTRKAFSDNKRAINEHNLRSGKVRGKTLGKRAPFADPRLFQKKRIPGKKSYAVLIGIDISGSTYGVNIALAKRAAMAQALLCQRAGVSFAVYAHTARPDDLNDWGESLNVDIYEIKSFDQPWNRETTQALEDIGPDAENLDGHTIEFYRKMIENRPETDKCILYYSDGKMPAANADEELVILQREIRVCARKRITLLGVGIRTDSPRRHGLDTVQVDDDGDIIKVVQHLEKVLVTVR